MSKQISGKEALEHIIESLRNFDDETEYLYELYNNIVGGAISYDNNTDTITIED